MDEPIIAQKGPYVIDVVEGKTYYWCQCGLSKKQPFCDGAHKGTAFKSLIYKALKNEKLYFCGCKKTSKKPFCDNTHKNLI